MLTKLFEILVKNKKNFVFYKIHKIILYLSFILSSIIFFIINIFFFNFLINDRKDRLATPIK